jgi:very-short-patch-repair endonuclease
MLAIEVDGYTHNLKYIKDRNRQTILENLGIRVIRFTDEEVLKDIDNVLRIIQREVNRISETSPRPPSKGE